MTEPIVRITTAEPIVRLAPQEVILRASAVAQGPKGAKGDPGDPGQVGSQRVYSWNMQVSDDRDQWVPSVGGTRRVFGNYDDGFGRILLGCDVNPFASPVQTTFTESFSVFPSWTGPSIDVEEGDVVDLVATGIWARNESTLTSDVVDTDLGNPNYSAAYDKNGFMLRTYFNARLEFPSVGFTSFNAGNPEPQSRTFSRWWRDGVWSSMDQTLTISEAAPMVPTLNAGPIWAHVGGLLLIEQISIVISSRTAPGLEGEVVGYKHTEDPAATVWTINHNQGKFPLSVQTFSVGGVLMIGEVHNLNLNQTQISFNTAVAGTATLVF